MLTGEGGRSGTFLLKRRNGNGRLTEEYNLFTHKYKYEYKYGYKYKYEYKYKYKVWGEH